MKTTRNDLIRSIATTNDLTMSQATHWYNCVWIAIEKAVIENTSVTIPIGTIKKIGRKPRQGRNPRTGARIQIPASIGLLFKPSKGIKSCINK